MPKTASRLSHFTESVIREPINHLIRLNFAKHEKTLVEVGERLLRLKDDLPG